MEAARAQLGWLWVLTYGGMLWGLSSPEIPTPCSRLVPCHPPLPHTRGRCHTQTIFQKFAILPPKSHFSL